MLERDGGDDHGDVAVWGVMLFDELFRSAGLHETVKTSEPAVIFPKPGVRRWFYVPVRPDTLAQPFWCEVDALVAAGKCACAPFGPLLGALPPTTNLRTVGILEADLADMLSRGIKIAAGEVE